MLGEIHTWTGYLVFLVVVVAAFTAFGKAKDAKEFVPGPYVIALVALDLQVLLGLVTYGLGSAWEARPEIAYIHPLFALVALGAGHALFGRAKRMPMAADAHRGAGRALIVALIAIAIAIGIASAPAFL
ncbi:MAG: hypothetical protein WD670_06705 [Actinomycetota bacterium]